MAARFTVCVLLLALATSASAARHERLRRVLRTSASFIDPDVSIDSNDGLAGRAALANPDDSIENDPANPKPIPGFDSTADEGLNDQTDDVGKSGRHRARDVPMIHNGNFDDSKHHIRVILDNSNAIQSDKKKKPKYISSYSHDNAGSNADSDNGPLPEDEPSVKPPAVQLPEETPAISPAPGESRGPPNQALPPPPPGQQTSASTTSPTQTTPSPPPPPPPPPAPKIMKGQCLLTNGKCPEGFRSEGVGGIRLTQGNPNPFRVLERGDVSTINKLLKEEEASYSVVTPMICCATSDDAKFGEGMYALASTCPDGQNTMQAGVLWDAKNDESPFTGEKDVELYDRKHKWVHPYLCQVKSADDIANARDQICMLSGECPAQLTAFGPAAILVDSKSVAEKSASQYPFEVANGKLAPVGEFAWVKPKLCCGGKAAGGANNNNNNGGGAPIKPDDDAVVIADSYAPARDTKCPRQFQWNNAYGIMFWIKPTSVFGDWSNVFHKGDINTRRNPAVWFYPNSLRLHIRSGTKPPRDAFDWNAQTNDGLDPEQQLQIDKWTHVAFTHYANALEVYVDGELVASKQDEPPVSTTAEWYCSDPWHEPAHAVVAALKGYNRRLKLKDVRRAFRMREYENAPPVTTASPTGNGAAATPTTNGGATPQTTPAAPAALGQQVAASFTPATNTQCANQNANFQGMAYTIMFWIKPTGTQEKWANIIHRGDIDTRRSPGLWFWPGTTRIHWRSSVKVASSPQQWDPETNNGIDLDQALPLNEWSQVTGVHSAGSMVVYVNGNKVKEEGNHPAPIPNSGPWWCSDPWYDPALASVVNFRLLDRAATAEEARAAFNSKDYEQH